MISFFFLFYPMSTQTMATIYAFIHYYLVSHPTISNFQWNPPETPFSSLSFLTITIFTYLFLSYFISFSLPISILKPLSALHNLILVIISFIMALGTFLSSFSQMENTKWLVCFPLDTQSSGPVFFWGHIFYLSKFLEFLDTLWIVLGGEGSKRRLSFLHVYHHAVVVVMCYIWMETSQSLMIVALITNAIVHTLMYTYYGLCAIGRRPRWKRAVTDCQIVQFVFSFLVSGVMLYYHFSGEGCSGIWGWCFNAGFNASLLYLFADFHSKNYDGGKKRKGGDEKKAA